MRVSGMPSVFSLCAICSAGRGGGPLQTRQKHRQLFGLADKTSDLKLLTVANLRYQRS